MENKKIAIIIIVLVLIAGTGTFVFASREGNFDEEDINYKNNEPTYNRVDNEIKGQDVPVINDNNSNDINNSTGNEIIDNEINNITNSTTNNSSTRPTQNGSQTRPSTSRPNNNTGNNTNGTQNGGISGGAETTTPTTPTEPEKPETPNHDDSNQEDVGFSASLSYSYNQELLTNQDIKLTINANKNIEKISDESGNWIISGNKAERIFQENTNGIVTVINDGVSIPLAYTIDKIDKVKLIATISYSETNKTYRPIEVTIKSDKEIKAVSESGWKYIDKYTITKSFEENINKTIIVEDEAKNQTEVNYKIENYDDRPNVVTNKNDAKTAITITYKNPIDGINSWTELDNGDWQAVVPIEKNEAGAIKLPNGETIEYDAAPNIEVTNISNRNEDGTWNRTNKPVTITIESDKELAEPEGLKESTISKDKKTVTFKTEKSGNSIVKVYDEKGNSTSITYEVESLDMMPPEIISGNTGARVSYKNGFVTATLRITEHVSISDSSWTDISGVRFTKKYQEEEAKNGITEVITFKDRYENKTTIKINIYYSEEESTFKIEYEVID